MKLKQDSMVDTKGVNIIHIHAQPYTVMFKGPRDTSSMSLLCSVTVQHPTLRGVINSQISKLRKWTHIFFFTLFFFF